MTTYRLCERARVIQIQEIEYTIEAPSMFEAARKWEQERTSLQPGRITVVYEEARRPLSISVEETDETPITERSPE